MITKRIVNIRVTCVFFIGLMFGIVFCREILLNRLSNWAIALIILGVLIFSVAIWIYAHLTRNYNAKHEYRKDISSVLKISSILLIYSFLLGMFLTINPVLKVLLIKNYSGEVQVEGEISDYIKDNSTYKKFLLSNCTITSEKTENIDYKIVVYVDHLANLKLGDKIKFSGSLKAFGIEGRNSLNIYGGIAYQVYVNSSDIKIINNNASVKDKIQSKTKDVLEDNLNQDNALIALGILFGEKSNLSTDIKEMFSYAGISHILAVSGLHISVLVMAIYFVLKILKVNKYARLIILSVVLGFYSYLCSFSPSVCRASVMAIILCICDLLQVRYDSLSSLGIAGSIILIFNPFSLFTVSFQLSFLCIFAIIAIAPTFIKIFQKIKFPKFLATGLGISIATNLAILPVCQNVFLETSLLGVITNIFVLPIFSITYILLFFAWLIALIIAPLGKLLFVPNLFLQLIKVIADYVSQISIGRIKLFYISYWVLVLLVAIFMFIHFLMIKKHIKLSMACVFLTMLLTMFFCNEIPNKYPSEYLVFSSKHKYNTCMYIENNDVTLIGSNVKDDTILYELKNLKLKRINNVIAYDLQLNDLQNFLQLCKDANVDCVFVPQKFNYPAVTNKFDNVKIFDTSVQIKNLKINTIEYLESTIGVYISCGLGGVLVPEISPTNAESRFLEDNFGAITDILYLNNDNTKLDLTKFDCDYYIFNDGNTIAKEKDIGQIELFIIEYKRRVEL